MGAKGVNNEFYTHLYRGNPKLPTRMSFSASSDRADELSKKWQGMSRGGGQSWKPGVRSQEKSKTQRI